MINPQLLDYVRAQRATGLSKDAITQALAAGGWSAQDANEAFMAIEGVKTPPPPPPTSPGPTGARMITPPVVVAGAAVNPPIQAQQAPMGGQSSAMTPPVAIIQPRPIMAASELNTAPVRVRHTGRWILIIVIVLILLAVAGAAAWIYMNPSILTQYLPQTSQPAPTYVPTTTLPTALAPEAYTDSQNGFSFIPPTGWQKINTNVLGTDVIFANTASPGDGANINVTSGTTTLSLDSYVAMSKKELGTVLTNYKLVNEATTTVNSIPAYILGGTFRQGTSTLENLQLIVVSNYKWYVVTGTAASSSWNGYKDMVETSFSTFKLQ